MGRAKRSKVAKPKKKADTAFSKQKKKVGKKILKSNETIISIKTRKIALPEQHTSKDNKMVFKGKSITEYITGTKHTNSNQRVQNLVNIQEMLSANLYLIEPNAGALIDRLGTVLQDPEENVRSSALVLVRTVLNHIRSEDLLPFLQVFVAQLSSGMLHIDKGIQKTTVLVLLSLFQNHLANAMTFSEPLLSSLVTLMTTNRNKQNILLYFQAISQILKFYAHSEDSQSYDKLKTTSVNLYKYTSRQEVLSTRSSHPDLLVRVCECALPHVETIWLEDTPSQVYAQAEPNVLKTVSGLVELLILLHRSELHYSTAAIVKLNNICKSVAGRFPLTCSVPNRDAGVLWCLNLKIAQLLVLVKKFAKVERYFVHSFRTRIKTLSGEDVTEGLDLLAQIPVPEPGTIAELLLHTHSTHPTHTPLFLAHFVRTAWIQAVDLNGNTQFLASLQQHINHVAPDIVTSYYSTPPSVTDEGAVTTLPTQIFSLCLDKKVFGSLSELEQTKCLELFFRSNMKLPAKAVADLGHVAKTSSVRSKFYSVLMSLLHEERVTIADYISILLSQANKDDEEEEEKEPDFGAVMDFTSELLSKFSALPAVVKQNLLHISLPQIVERLYAGLSHFSLAAYLLILIRFNSYTSSNELQLDIPETLLVKLGKIIASLIFNRDSLSDWGEDIVKLAVKVSINNHVVFRYITQQMNLGTKDPDMLAWYLQVVLKFLQSGQVYNKSGDVYKCDSVYRTGVDKLVGYLQGRISDREFQVLGYRLQDAFSVTS